MKRNFIGKILSIALLGIGLLTLTACNRSEPTNVSKPTPVPDLSSSDYDDFDEGLTEFAGDYYMIKSYLFDMAEYSDIKGNLKGEKQKEYYDGLENLFSMLDLELMTLLEYDSIVSSDGSSDRVDGILLSTGRYGYKIRQSSKLKFGCDETTSNSKYTMTGEVSSSSNLLKSDAIETIMGNIKYTTKTEILIEGKEKFVLRYVKSASGAENDSVLTRAAYVVYENGVANVCYYEGNRDQNSLIAFSQLIDYNMNAITFGLGTVLDFEVNMQ